MTYGIGRWDLTEGLVESIRTGSELQTVTFVSPGQLAIGAEFGFIVVHLSLESSQANHVAIGREL
jgi:hypothetical protein